MYGTHAVVCYSKPRVPYKPYIACKGYLKTRIFIFQVAHDAPQTAWYEEIIPARYPASGYLKTDF